MSWAWRQVGALKWGSPIVCRVIDRRTVNNGCSGVSSIGRMPQARTLSISPLYERANVSFTFTSPLIPITWPPGDIWEIATLSPRISVPGLTQLGHFSEVTPDGARNCCDLAVVGELTD